MGTHVSNAEVIASIRDAVSSLDKFQQAYDARLEKIETAINRPFALSLFGQSGGLRDELAALGQFARGREDKFRSLSIGSDPDGGFLVSPALSNEIKQKLFDSSPIRRLARIVEIGAGSDFVEPIDVSDADAAWVGEGQSRPETSAGDICLNRIPLDEMYALVKVTQRLLDDSQFNLGEWIKNNFTVAGWKLKHS